MMGKNLWLDYKINDMLRLFDNLGFRKDKNWRISTSIYSNRYTSHLLGNYLKHFLVCKNDH